MLYKTALYSVTQEYTAVKIGIDTVVASNEIEHVPANTQTWMHFSYHFSNWSAGKCFLYSGILKNLRKVDPFSQSFYKINIWDP